jgi:CheY-like chemotaxis protein
MTSLLIVDDNASMRRLIKALVAGLAASIYECTDGTEALELYERFRPDLILMDIEMAQMDGLTATRQIIATHPETKIVMVTKYGNERLREAARQAGACGYVLKENLMELRDVLACTLPQPQQQ